MSIEEKDGRSLAAAESRIENENQDHCYSEDQTEGPVQATFEGKGESAERQVKASPATLGRHIKSAKDGAEVTKEREAHVLGNRTATERLFSKKGRR